MGRLLVSKILMPIFVLSNIYVFGLKIFSHSALWRERCSFIKEMMMVSRVFGLTFQCSFIQRMLLGNLELTSDYYKNNYMGNSCTRELIFFVFLDSLESGGVSEC